MTELKVAFRKFMNAPKNTSTGICILCQVIQSCRINHLLTKYGNDCKSCDKKHEIEERLSTNKKGFVFISFAKHFTQNNPSKLFKADVRIWKKELFIKQDICKL